MLTVIKAQMLQCLEYRNTRTLTYFIDYETAWPLWKTVCPLPLWKSNIKLYNPTILFLRIYPKELKIATPIQSQTGSQQHCSKQPRVETVPSHERTRRLKDAHRRAARSSQTLQHERISHPQCQDKALPESRSGTSQSSQSHTSTVDCTALWPHLMSLDQSLLTG